MSVIKHSGKLRQEYQKFKVDLENLVKLSQERKMTGTVIQCEGHPGFNPQ